MRMGDRFRCEYASGSIREYELGLIYAKYHVYNYAEMKSILQPASGEKSNIDQVEQSLIVQQRP